MSIRRKAAAAAAVALVAGWAAAKAEHAAPSPALAGLARTGIPAPYANLYVAAAATCPGLSWTVLAGIGEVESDHGRSALPGVHSGSNYAGAEGPMQFKPSTFAAYGTGPDRPLSPYDPADAVYSAASMLCANGARGGTDAGIRQAVYAYNHAGWYVAEVLAAASRYSQLAAA